MELGQVWSLYLFPWAHNDIGQKTGPSPITVSPAVAWDCQRFKRTKMGLLPPFGILLGKAWSSSSRWFCASDLSKAQGAARTSPPRSPAVPTFMSHSRRNPKILSGVTGLLWEVRCISRTEKCVKEEDRGKMKDQSKLAP